MKKNNTPIKKPVKQSKRKLTGLKTKRKKVITLEQ